MRTCQKKKKNGVVDWSQETKGGERDRGRSPDWEVHVHRRNSSPETSPIQRIEKSRFGSVGKEGNQGMTGYGSNLLPPS